MYRNTGWPLLMTAGVWATGNDLQQPAKRWASTQDWPQQAFSSSASHAWVSLLEVVNYLEHYGLQRQNSTMAASDQVAPVHSWNSNHLITNCFLYHLQRHSDHHALPARRYQTLRHFDDSPQLPTGYAEWSCSRRSLRLWFAVMNPRVERFMARQQTVPGADRSGPPRNESTSRYRNKNSTPLLIRMHDWR